MGIQRYKKGFPLEGPYIGYIGTIFIIWFTIMGSKILLVDTYPPTRTSLVQMKVMQEIMLGAQRISILWPKSKGIQR